MSIELAERLRSKLTDQWVVVDSSVPELRRFSRSTGRVKTVNMNGRALVEFDNGVDIGWYDIDPAFLTIVDGPRPQAVPEAAAKPVRAAAPAGATLAAATSPAPVATASQAAPGAAASRTPAPPASGTGKPSPLDLIRKQQAAKKMVAESANPTAEVSVPEAASAVPTAVAPVAPVAATPAPAESNTAEKNTGEGSPAGRPLSPIEKIRQMGAAKRS